ncbi:MAG: histidine--tRNA ligase [Planctomycetota bacterium]|nr:histidine--tRNA ligase [Planctomycetota bacterium]
MAKVKPRVYRGMRDLLPEQVSARRWLIDTIRRVYELYGFVPLETSAIEYLDVLTGSAGDEANRSIFRVNNPDKKPSDPDSEALGLRFDLTVPLARVVAQHRELPRPFRRYQIASVWRADKPGPGRFREFTQCDIDSVGVSSEVADVEIIAAMCDTLSALEVGNYLIRFSSRKILNLALPFADIPADRAEAVFRVLDKLDKIGMKKVRLELSGGYRDESGDSIPGVGLSGSQVGRIEQFLELKSDKRDDLIRQLRETFASVAGAEDEISVLERMSRQLAELGYGDDRVCIDLSVARGLAYYTGPVFEAILPDAPEFGSVFGGGRYDDLVRRFTGESIPATGASIGVDRLLAALTKLDKAREQKSTAQVLVSAIDPAMMDDYLQITYELRRAGISAEFYLGPPKRFGKQIKYADQYEIPIVVVCGSDEKAEGTVTLKDMAAGRRRASEVQDREAWRDERPGQITTPRGELVSSVRDLLDRIRRADA